MTEEWEYTEEAIQAERERESQERFERMPAVCQRCRWLDWYHLEECVYQFWPRRAYQDGEACELFARDFHLVWWPWLSRRLWDLQYWLWDLRTRRYKLANGRYVRGDNSDDL